MVLFAQVCRDPPRGHGFFQNRATSGSFIHRMQQVQVAVGIHPAQREHPGKHRVAKRGVAVADVRCHSDSTSISTWCASPASRQPRAEPGPAGDRCRGGGIRRMPPASPGELTAVVVVKLAYANFRAICGDEHLEVVAVAPPSGDACRVTARSARPVVGAHPWRATGR